MSKTLAIALLGWSLAASQAAARWPRYFIVKEKLSFPREALQDAYRTFAEDLRADERDSSDGLRLAVNVGAALVLSLSVSLIFRLSAPSARNKPFAVGK